jgi:hypothetical protein
MFKPYIGHLQFIINFRGQQWKKESNTCNILAHCYTMLLVLSRWHHSEICLCGERISSHKTLLLHWQRPFCILHTSLILPFIKSEFYNWKSVHLHVQGNSLAKLQLMFTVPLISRLIRRNSEQVQFIGLPM